MKKADRMGLLQFPYSLLWLLTRLPSILPLESNAQVYSSRAASKRIYPLLVRLRNFENAALGFETESLLTDVFESIKACIIAGAYRNSVYLIILSEDIIYSCTGGPICLLL